ncbi:uncharacterized protein LOC144134121 [Amblyomma americanum]
MEAGDTKDNDGQNEKPFDEMPMVWDRKSILITVGFFGGVIVVAWAAFTLVSRLGGNKMILLTREEAARLVRERGCKCRKARNPSVTGTGRPRKEDYVCNCPPPGKHKPKVKTKAKAPAKKSAPKPKQVSKESKKEQPSVSRSTGVKESL